MDIDENAPGNQSQQGATRPTDNEAGHDSHGEKPEVTKRQWMRTWQMSRRRTRLPRNIPNHSDGATAALNMLRKWPTHQPPVGASLLAIALVQSPLNQLTRRHRWQASSHRFRR